MTAATLATVAAADAARGEPVGARAGGGSRRPQGRDGRAWSSSCCSSRWRCSRRSIAPYDPLATSWTAVRKAPSAAHWFGTDEIGRDVLSPRHLRRARLAAAPAWSRSASRSAIGVPLGLLAGYAGGWIDARAVAHRRRHAGRAVPDPGDRARRLPRAQPHQRDDRHRRHRHADLRAPDARPDAGGQGRGLCRGRARRRQSALAHRAAPRAAQHRAAAAGAGDARHRRRRSSPRRASRSSASASSRRRRAGAACSTPRSASSPRRRGWPFWPGFAIFLLVLSFNLWATACATPTPGTNGRASDRPNFGHLVQRRLIRPASRRRQCARSARAMPK